MKLSKIVCLTIITLLATACTKLKTVDYYKEHIEEAYKVHNKCIEKYDKGDVLKGDYKENCDNAGKAIAFDMKNSLLKNPTLY